MLHLRVLRRGDRPRQVAPLCIAHYNRFIDELTVDGDRERQRELKSDFYWEPYGDEEKEKNNKMWK